MAWNELLDAPKKILGGFTTAAGFKTPDLSGTAGDVMEAGISPLTAAPRMSGRFLSSMLSGKQPDGPVGAALNYMGGDGSVSADATQTGPLGVKGLISPAQQVAVTTPAALTVAPSRTPGGFVPTMAPSHTPGEVVDVDPTRGKLGGMFGFNKEGAAAPGGDTMLLGGAGARSYQTPMYAADIAKSLGVTDPARMAKNDWSDGSVNQKLAMQQADNAVAHERHLRNMADVEKLRNNRSLQEHFNELLYSRNTLGMPQSAMWELAGKNFEAQQGRNKIAGDLEVERIKGEFGMKAKADDLEIRRLDREAERRSNLEVAALKAEENRETALGVAKLKMDESRTEHELAAEKELRKGKVELAMPAATTAGTDLETAIAAQEMGLEPRGVKKNTFLPDEPAGFYNKKTGKLVDAATIKSMRGKTTGSSAADIAASLRSQGKTAEQIKAELIAQGFKPGTR